MSTAEVSKAIVLGEQNGHDRIGTDYVSSKGLMHNAMDVDDPNLHYVTPFLLSNRELAQTDDLSLAHLLYHLGDSVPTRSIDVSLEEIKRLNMVDLRPLLASGNFDDVAHTVLERLPVSPFHSAELSFRTQSW